VAAVALLGFNSTAQAAVGPCDPYPDVPVNVTPVFNDPFIDNSKSIADLRTMNHSAPRHVPLMLTNAPPVVNLNVSTQSYKLANGLSCTRVDHVDVAIGYKNPIIYIASEVPSGGCPYMQLTNHAQKNIGVMRAVMNDYVPQLVDQMKQYLKLYGIVREEKAGYGIGVVHDQLQTMLQESKTHIYDESARRLQDANSMDDSNSMNAACNGQLRGIQKQWLNTHLQ